MISILESALAAVATTRTQCTPDRTSGFFGSCSGVWEESLPAE